VPVHDWSRVDPDIFHDFHTVWTGAIQGALNNGALPDGYYALTEQHFGRPLIETLAPKPSPVTVRGTQVPISDRSLAPVLRRQSFARAARTLRRSLAVRHVSGHRLVALLEIVSPANKDRASHVNELAAKVDSALAAGVHVLLVDLLPPGAHDPQGMHAAVLAEMDLLDEPYDLPPGRVLSLATYVAGPRIEVLVNHLRVGVALPDMPLFLRPPQYVNVPLEDTYQAAYRGMPAFWRDVLEGRSSAAG
jgi:hypothetical protein